MLYSAVALSLIFSVLWRLRRRSYPPGWLFGLYLILTGVERFLVEFIRAKDDRFVWGLSTAQVIAALTIMGGLALLLLLGRSQERLAPARCARRRAAHAGKSG